MADAKTRILLFGRTGSGKSTIANMLIRDSLNPPLLFGTSSGVWGKTKCMQREETETMVVVDTIGFGEAEGGTVNNEDAKLRLYDFFVQTTDDYNYFAYVHKWGKTDYLDLRLWEFFKDAFKGVEKNFIIIFTHSQPEFLEENMDHIERDFSGCGRYISVDFAGIDPKEDPSRAKAKRKDSRRKSSLKLLKDELKKSLPKPATAFIKTTLSKGRLLIIGRYASATRIVARLLVDGPDLTAAQTSYVVDLPSTFKGTRERMGRGWSVVETVAFESYHRLSPRDNVDLAELIADDIITAVQHGSYSHFIYVEGGGPVSKVDKLVWKILRGLLQGVEDNVVALIVNTKWPIVTDGTRNTNLDQNTKTARKLRNRFQGCRCFLYLDFPVGCSDDVSVTLEEKFKTRKDSLNALEEILCSFVAQRAEISLNDEDKIVLLSYLTSLFVPVAEAVKHPRIEWIRSLDPLSNLSKLYRELSAAPDPLNKLSMTLYRKLSPAPNEDTSMELQYSECRLDSADVCTSQLAEVFTTELVVGQSNMSHIYLEMKISHAPLQSIYVEVDSHDQGWSSYFDERGTYNNSWTWGELSIMDHRRKFKEKKDVPRLRVYTNLHACDEWQLHKKDISRANPEDESFLHNIQSGDKLILWLRSMYPGWANFSKRGLIRVSTGDN